MAREKYTTMIEEDIKDKLNKLAPYYTPKGKHIGANYVIEQLVLAEWEARKNEVEKNDRDSRRTSSSNSK